MSERWKPNLICSRVDAMLRNYQHFRPVGSLSANSVVLVMIVTNCHCSIVNHNTLVGYSYVHNAFNAVVFTNMSTPLTVHPNLEHPWNSLVFERLFLQLICFLCTCAMVVKLLITRCVDFGLKCNRACLSAWLHPDPQREITTFPGAPSWISGGI